MAGGICDDILIDEGFREIGFLHFGLQIEVWWHEEAAVELLVLPFGSVSLLKGSKSYFMKSISKDGATYARDINQLHQYLEAHFEEMHLGMSYFRDVSGTLAEQYVHEKTSLDAPTVDIPSTADLARLQRQIDEEQYELRGVADARLFLGNGEGLLGGYLTTDVRRKKGAIKEAQRDLSRVRDRAVFFEHLQREYKRKGGAVLFSFSIHANLQLVDDPSRFRDAIVSIVKELQDLDRYQVRQKLAGGKLQVQVEESKEPILTWIEQWLGGGMSPTQLERFKKAVPDLERRTRPRFMVTPKDDIKIDGSVREHRKLLGPRSISAIITRLDCAEDLYSDQQAKSSKFPLTIGRIVRNGSVTDEPFLLPLERCVHVYVSGTTGSGKSYAGRVIVEEAAQYKDLSILILDPRNQSAGMLVPEDRRDVLGKYTLFGMKREAARGFDFTYSGPGQRIGLMPSNLGDLATGRGIVSFKGMADQERCRLFADVLEGVFTVCSESETEATRLLVVVEEAHRFTKRRVDETARAEAARAEIVLDKVVREGRKFGICVLILSQTIRDFAYDAASIRQNTNTKCFLHNSDREVEYASDFLEHGRDIVQLPPATAIIYNPAWGATTVRIRPPFSKVWEFSPNETRRLVEGGASRSNIVSAEARGLLSVIRQTHASGRAPLRVGELSERAGISSKRKLNALLSELEGVKLIRSRYLQERGKPRIVELVSSEPADETRTDSDENGEAA